VKYLIIAIIAMVLGQQVYIRETNNRIDSAEREIAALKAELAAHREDAKTAVGKIYEDIGKVRFTQAALANSIRFATGK